MGVSDGKLGGCKSTAFVLDIPPSGAYMAEISTLVPTLTIVIQDQREFGTSPSIGSKQYHLRKLFEHRKSSKSGS
jgi:hypothetical protein